MCITSAYIRTQEESMVWDILCPERADKARRLLDERGAPRLFDIPMEKYDFCPECVGRIDEHSDESYD